MTESANQPSKWRHLIGWAGGGARAAVRWGPHVLVILVAVGLAFIGLTNYRGYAVMRSLQAELEARGLATNLGHVRAHDPHDGVVAANDTTRYWRAALALSERRIDAAQGIPVVGYGSDDELEWPGWGERIHGEPADRLARYAEAMDGFIPLVEQARSGEQFSWGLIDQWAVGQAPVEELPAMRRAARSLAALVEHQAAVEDFDAALDTASSIIDLAWAFADDSAAIVYLVRRSVDALGISTLEETLARGEAGVDALNRARRAIRRQHDAYDLKQMIGFGLSLTADHLERVRIETADTAKELEWHVLAGGRMGVELNGEVGGMFDFAWQQAPSRASVLGYRIWSALCPGWYRLSYLQEVERWGSSSDETLAMYDDLDQPVNALARQVRPPEGERLEFGSTRSLVRGLLHGQASLRVAEAALTVEMHRVEYGEWPRDIGEVSDLPLDLYTDAPLRFGPLTAEDAEMTGVAGDGGRELEADDVVGVAVWSAGEREDVDRPVAQDGITGLRFRLLDPIWRGR